MNNISWTKALGFGALIWLIMFALMSAVVGFGVYQMVWIQFLAALVAGVIAYVFARYADISTAGQAFAYGAIWVVLGVLLDSIITFRFDAAIFTNWAYWLSYLLVLAAPFTQLGSSQTAGHSHA